MDIGDQVFDIEHALDVVGTLLIDRNTRVSRLDNVLFHSRIALADLDRHDVDSRLHNLRNIGIHEVDNTRQHLAFLLCLVVRSQVNRVRQFVHREVIALGIEAVVNALARTHKHHCQRLDEGIEHRERRRSKTRETQRIGVGKHLGQNLAKEQQEERDADRLEDKSPRYRLEHEHHIDNASRDNRDADIDQIVDNQDCSQQSIALGQQSDNGFGAGLTALLHLADLLRGEREKCGLRPRNKGRNTQ